MAAPNTNLRSTGALSIQGAPGAGLTWSQTFKRRPTPLYQPVQPFTLTNTCGGVSPGTTVSTANSAAGGKAFDTINIGGGATEAYDSTYAAHNFSSIKLTTVAASTVAFRWSGTSFNIQPTLWFRMNFLAQALPAGNVRIMQMANSPTLCAALQLLTTGALRWIDTSSATVITTTNKINPGQWSRMEGFVYGNATGGHVELQLFNNIESLVPTEIITSAANTFDQIAIMLFGTNVSIANYGPFWYSDVGITNIGYMGPPVFPTYVPQLEAFPGPTWQKNYQHKQVTYPSIFDMYVGPALGTVNVSSPADNTLLVNPQGSVVNVNVSGQSDNSLLLTLPGSVSSVNVSGQADNIVTETMLGAVSNVNAAAASGSLLLNIAGTNSAVNVSALAGIINEAVLGAAATVNVLGVSGGITASAPGVTGLVNVAAIAGNFGQQAANIIGSPASVTVMAPSGTVFKEPDGTWWRVYPAYRSYPT